MAELVLVAVGRVDPPYSSHCFAQHKCHRLGADVEFLNVAASMANIKLKFCSAPSYNEAQGAVANGTYDISATTTEFENALDYGTTLYDVASDDSWVLVAKPLDKSVQMEWVMLTLFRPGVWGLVALCGFLVGTLRALTQSHCDEIVMHNTKYGSKRQGKPFWRRVLSSSWLIFLSIFLGCFSNLLTVVFAIPKDKPSYHFTGFEHFVQKLYDGKCKVVSPYQLDELGVFARTVNSTNAALAQKLQTAMSKYPMIHKQSRSEIGDMLMSSKKCIVAIDYQSMEYYYKTAYCGKLQTLKYDTYFPLHQFAYFSRPGLHLKTLDVVLNSESVRAMQKRIWRSYLEEEIFENTKNKSSLASTCGYDMNEQTVSIAIPHLLDVFAVLVIGLTVAVLHFVYEFLKSRLGNQK